MGGAYKNEEYGVKTKQGLGFQIGRQKMIEY